MAVRAHNLAFSNLVLYYIETACVISETGYIKELVAKMVKLHLKMRVIYAAIGTHRLSLNFFNP
jgi:hypothetical protein